MSKTILITGASSGLGLSHAIYLTSQGYNVIGTSRTANKLKIDQLKEIFLRDHKKYKFINKEKTKLKSTRLLISEEFVKNIDGYLKKIKFMSMDITNNTSVNNVINEIISYTKIDVLINNAGYVYWGPINEITIKEAMDIFNVNYFGCLRVIKAIIPHMSEKKSGLIINTTSLAGIVGIPFISHYSASKSGIERITEALFTELRPFNIRLCSILPSDINTAVDANMVLRHKKIGKYISTDIRSIINFNPVSNNSVYSKRSKDMWEIFIRNHILAPPPITVSKKIENIIRKKNPKIHYKVGNLIQAKIMPFIKAILPEKLFLKILAKQFGL